MELSSQIKACKKCALHSQCKGPVPGVNVELGRGGILFVGEAPSQSDDRNCLPFTGLAGQILRDHLLAKTSLHLDDLSYTNAVKCHPPLRKLDGKKDPTRKPLPEEMAACEKWLWAEIAVLNPELIVGLGDTACKMLIPEFKSVAVQHGKFWRGRTEAPVLAAVSPSMCVSQSTNYTLFRGDMEVLGVAYESGVAEIVIDELDIPDYSPVNVLRIRGGSQYSPVAIDTEATTDDEAGDRLGTVPWSAQFSRFEGQAFFVGADDVRSVQGLGNRDLIIHNAMYDIPMLKKMGHDLTFNPCVQDSMIAAQVLQTEPAGLKDLGLRHAGVHMQAYSDVIREAQLDKSAEYLNKVIVGAKKHKWNKKRPMLVVDPDTGTEKISTPWPPVKNALRILKDLCEKPNEIDPVARWSEVTRAPEVEKVLGPMPIASLADVEFDKAMTYACRDADVSLRVWPHLKKKLEEMDLWDVYRMDMDAMPLVLMMEEAGMGVALDRLDDAEAIFLQKMQVIEAELEKIAGRPINPGSAKQTSWLLFEHLGLPHHKKRGAETSTNDKLIAMMAHLHPAVAMVQEWREFAKLISSYIRPIRAKVLKTKDKRLRARLKVVGTPTGRMTANDPNVLAIPARSEWGKLIKKSFTARPGCCIINADYSQIELRIFTHETGEESLISDYLSGADLHRRTAALMFGIKQEDVTDEQRSYGKTVNFGVIYGIGPQGLAVQLKCTERQAEQFICNYFAGYTKVRAWMDDVESECRRFGYTRDMWGRIRHIGGIYSTDKGVYSEAVRQACNAKIQSAASGFAKKAMKECVALVQEFRDRGYVCDPWVQVHDALVFEVSEEVKEEFGRRLKALMEGVRELVVPVKVDVSYGPSWGEQTKLKEAA